MNGQVIALANQDGQIAQQARQAVARQADLTLISVGIMAPFILRYKSII
jgi:hypothetical protein